MTRAHGDPSARRRSGPRGHESRLDGRVAIAEREGRDRIDRYARAAELSANSCISVPN